MENKELGPTESASEKALSQLEEHLEPGGVRDLWLSLRRELDEGGPERARTYLDAEFGRRKAVVQTALEELSNQLEETK